MNYCGNYMCNYYDEKEKYNCWDNFDQCHAKVTEEEVRLLQEYTKYINNNGYLKDGAFEYPSPIMGFLSERSK
jgi:hypothetical protein